MVQSQFGFLAFRISARAMGAEVRFAPERNFTADVDALLDYVDDRTRILFLANPGNPTGTYLPASEVRRLHAALPPRVLLVHDGAYAEFVDDPAYEDGLALAREASNVVMTRTFSKLHGLAALRIGWGYGHPAIADAVERIRPPFNTTVPAQEAAAAALADVDFQNASLEHCRVWRAWLTDQLEGMGLQVVPSAANFVLVRFQNAERAAAADAFLQSRGLIVRAVAGYGLPDCLRITIGTEPQLRAVTEALAAFMAG
jgi:histidinol-phosphate aminotransferase